jgi:4-amino-4-deoxy-L-arabinose transferase-like glycosyltransferase
VFLFFYNLWTGSLRPWDEGWYGEVAREIVEDRLGWLTLHYNHEPFFQKPPFFLWMTAVTYHIFGVTEFSTRFWSALSGAGCVILLYLFGKRVLHSEERGVFLSLTLLGFTLFYKQSRMGMMDAPLAFFVLLGAFFFCLGRTERNYLFWVGPAVGVAFMIKGFAAVPFPAALVLFSLVSGERRLLTDRKLLTGMVAGAAICMPWHLYQYLKYGALFTDEYFFTSVARRSFEVLEGHPSRGWLYYLQVILSEFPLGKLQAFTLPLFFFLALREKDRERRSVLRLSAVTITATLVLFTIVKTKFRWYIVPVYPFLALATVESMDYLFLKAGRYRRLLINSALVLLIIVPVARVAFYKEYRVLDFRPELKMMGLALKEQSGNTGEVLFYGIEDEPTALFYAGRKMIRATKETLSEYLRGPKPFVCLMAKKDGFHESIRTGDSSFILVKETEGFALFRRGGP